MGKDNRNGNPNNFKIDRISKWKDFYGDEVTRQNRQGITGAGGAFSYTNPTQVRKALYDAIANRKLLVQNSEKLYMVNPIYATIINYYANMFTWQYKVTPHKVWTKSKAKAKKQLKADDFNMMYNQMLEIVDGLNIENKFPQLLVKLFTCGALYITTFLDEESLTINTFMLPDNYCRTIGQTQFGTYIIQFDCSYFMDLGYSDAELNTFLKTWPKEFTSAYRKYQNDPNNNRWYTLDPRFSTALMMNDRGIPTLFYLYGGILNYEKYQDNELERNTNLLRYLVVHTIPHYENELLFEIDEVKSLHQSLKKIVDNGDKARLITTYGDVHVDQISENDNIAADVLNNAYKAVFSNAGLNSTLFVGDSVTALEYAVARDKQFVWKFVQVLVSFYNISINNWLDFKGYEADIDILPISPYTYSDDVKQYKENATLGVGKIDYIVASGTKQRYIQDVFNLEKFLDLTQIVPLQTSYTQTAEDRKDGDDTPSNDDTPKSNEPGLKGEDSDSKE